MRAILNVGVTLLICGIALAAEDPREIVRRSTDGNRRTEKLAQNYTFIEREEERGLDSKGRTDKRDVKTYDITLTEGSPYRRLISRNDKPLSADEERKEQQKLDRSIAQRRAETPEQRARRLEDWRRRREHEREFLREVPEAFDFRLAGEDIMDGRKVYVIDATPRRDYRPKSTPGKFLPKMKGRIWIDEQTYDWAKVDAETIDTVSIGGFAVRFSPGTHLSVLQTRVNDEIWLPKQIKVTAQARIFLIKKMSGEFNFTFSNYKKFQSDSRIISAEGLN